MANTSIVPRGFWSFPSLSLPDMWEDDFDIFPSVNRVSSLQNLNNNVSISEDDKHFHVEAAMPGVNPDDIDISIQNGMLWIHGKSMMEEGGEKKKYYQRAKSEFSYRLALPKNIDQNAEVDASCDNGMVMITIPKSQQAQPKKIPVKAKSGKQNNGHIQRSEKSKQSAPRTQQVH